MRVTDGDWEELSWLLKDYTASCPREIKAWAMALTILGFSARQIEEELRRRFPGSKTPNFATIARWQRTRPIDPRAHVAWSGFALRASRLLSERFDEIRSLPFNKMMLAALEMHEIYEIGREGWLRTRERRRQRRQRYGV